MTASEHDRIAASHLAEARDTDASSDRGGLLPCMLVGSRGFVGNGRCWEAAGERHVEVAGAHTEAAALLRERAREACVGVPAEDRRPARLVAAVDGTAPIVDDGSKGTVPGGVTLVVRTVPGVTSARLRASLECELARHAAFGSIERPDGLGARGAPIEVRVIPTARGFAVELRSSDAATNARLVEDARAAHPPVLAP